MTTFLEDLVVDSDLKKPENVFDLEDGRFLSRKLRNRKGRLEKKTGET